MTYTVIWKLTAIALYERLNSASADPDRVRQAADRIDFILRRYP